MKVFHYPDDPDEAQGQLDLGRALHPVQFRDTLAEQRQYRAAVLKFGGHGEGHVEDMYEHGLKYRRHVATNNAFKARRPR